MPFRSLIEKIVVCLLITGLLASLAAESRSAGCINAGGAHSILEGALADDGLQVADVPAAAGVVTPGFKADPEGCSSCQGVFAPQHWRSRRSRVLNAPLVLPLPAADQAAVSRSPVDSQVFPGPFPSSPSPRTPEAILLHRTVVLLI